MKKLITLVLAFAVAFSLIACGGSGSKPPNMPTSSTPAQAQTGGGADTTVPDIESIDSTAESSGNASGLADLTMDNWQSVVKAFSGIEVAIPDGWTLVLTEGGCNRHIEV